jgi:hypothetical protein
VKKVIFLMKSARSYSIAPRIPPGLAIGKGSGKWEMGQVTREMGNGNGKGQRGKSMEIYWTSIEHLLKIY